MRIYDAALSSEDVQSLFNGGQTSGLSQAPEPSGLALLAIGLVGAVTRHR